MSLDDQTNRPADAPTGIPPIIKAVIGMAVTGAIAIALIAILLPKPHKAGTVLLTPDGRPVTVVEYRTQAGIYVCKDAEGRVYLIDKNAPVAK